ncbi:MAG: SH3 domain-containing protein [Anaerolineae bacterium]|nr:SH3 domain-containing protein [Anaerolineae bacterium]
MTHSYRLLAPALSLALGVALAACGSNIPPSAIITAPPQNAQFFLGEDVRIEGQVTGANVRQAEVYINNFKFAVIDQPVAPNTFVVDVTWPSSTGQAGTAVIQIKGVDSNGNVIVVSDALFIMLLPEATTPAPPPAPVQTTTPESNAPATTPTPAPVLASPLPENGFANVRAQPSTDARLLGRITMGQSVMVIGKTADGQWYLVNFAAAPDGRGWVAARVVNLSGDANALPIVDPAASTALVTPTSAPAPAPASTPASLAASPQPPYVRLKAGQDFVNVRAGPDVNTQRLGTLDSNTPTASVRARSPDGQWWQIYFPSAPEGTGWVFAQLVDFVGEANSVPIASGAARAQPTVTLIPVQLPSPTPTPIPPSALLPYSQNMRFSPRDDIGDVPLGHNGEPKTAKLLWQINGAVKAELEITTAQGPGIFSNCPAGNLASITPNDAAGKRIPLTLPSGEYTFTITERGYYLFTIYVTKASGETTTIPRNVIVDCYKTQ